MLVSGQGPADSLVVEGRVVDPGAASTSACE